MIPLPSPWTGELESPLVLASASPRRTWILSQLGVPHEVDPAHFDEDSIRLDDPAELVLILAREKALAVSRRRPGSLVLGSDTLVYLSPRVLGKPRDAAEARSTLRSLSGRDHMVWTGVHLARDGEPLEGRSIPSRVRFRTLTDAEIEAYVASGDPLDKAGSYGIQGIGLGLVEAIEGCFYAVAGLPVAATLELLRSHRKTLP